MDLLLEGMCGPDEAGQRINRDFYPAQGGLVTARDN